LVFAYAYVTGSREAPQKKTPYYQVDISNPTAPLLTQLDQTQTENKLELFAYLGRDYIVQHFKEIKPLPDEKIALITERNIVATSLHPNQEWLLVTHTQKKTSPETPQKLYSLYNFKEKSYYNLTFFTQLPHPIQADEPILLSWTGFNNDVLVEYEDKDRVYYGRGEIDINTAKLKNTTVFKT